MKDRNFIFTTILLTLGSFGLCPVAQAVSPAPDGGYPGANTAEGQNALLSLTTGGYNTALGYYSLKTITTGVSNTAIGAGTLFANTGDQNTATGAGALLRNTSGANNTATGVFALYSNTEGHDNMASGGLALFSNTTGAFNTASGGYALHSNTIGSRNTADGDSALYFNTTGNDNTATGTSALYNNTTASKNTANGQFSLNGNTTGDNNTAIGADGLEANTTANHNTAVGGSALLNATGGFNTALGAFAGQNLTIGSNNIDIGYNVVGLAGEGNTVRIGNTDITDTYIRGISGATASGGAAVFVNGNGKLGTLSSSERFKDEIKPMDRASEAILALRPVSFRYKKEIDPQGVPQFGLVAEEVERVNRDLVIRDAEGKPQTVRYEQVNAMLLNEFLKEHATVRELKKEIAALTATVNEQAREIQRVSAQVQLSKFAQDESAVADLGRRQWPVINR